MADQKPAVPGLNQTPATGAGTPMDQFLKENGVAKAPKMRSVQLPSGTVATSPHRTPIEQFLATAPGIAKEGTRLREKQARGSISFLWDEFTDNVSGGLSDVATGTELSMADGPERVQMLALLGEIEYRKRKLAALERPETGMVTEGTALLTNTLARSILPAVSGGVTGGVAGAGAGALAGSVVPGLGTAAGGGAGWIAGSATGAAAAAGQQSYAQTAVQLMIEMKDQNPEMTWAEIAEVVDPKAQQQGWETAALTGGAAALTAGLGAGFGAAARQGPRVVRDFAALLRRGPAAARFGAPIVGRQTVEGLSEGADQYLQNEKARDIGLDRGEWDDVGTAFALGALADITPQIIFAPASLIKNRIRYGSWFKPTNTPPANESPAPNDDASPPETAPMLALPAPDKPAGLLEAPSRERDHTIWATQQMQNLRDVYEGQQKLDPRYADPNISKAIYTLNYLMDGWEKKRELDAETDLAVRNSPEYAAKLNEVNDRLNLLDLLTKPERAMTVQRWYWRSNKLNSKRAGEKARNAEVMQVQTDAKGNPIVEINKKTGARFVRLKNGDTRSLKVGEMFDVTDPSPVNMLLSPYGRTVMARVQRELEAHARAEAAQAQAEMAAEAARAETIAEARNKAEAKMAAENMVEGNARLPAPPAQKALPAPTRVYGDGFTMEESWPDQSPETIAALERAGFVDILEKGAERLGDADLERVAIAARRMLEAGDTVTADKLVEFIENEVKAEEAATKATKDIRERMNLLAEARKITANSDNLIEADVFDGLTRQRIAISRHRMGLSEKDVYTREEMRDMGFSDSDIDAMLKRAGTDVSSVQRRITKEGAQAAQDAELAELYGTPREFVASIKDKRLRKALAATLSIFARVRGIDMDRVSFFELNRAFLNRAVDSGDSAAFRPEEWVSKMTGKIGKAAIGIRSGKTDQRLVLDIAHEMMHFTLRALGYERKQLQALWRAVKNSNDPVVKTLLTDKVYQAQYTKIATTKGVDVADALMGEEFLAETVAKVIGGHYVDRYYRRDNESRVAYVIRRVITYIREIFEPMVGKDVLNDLLSNIANASNLSPAQIIAFDDGVLMARNYGDGDPSEALPLRENMESPEELFGDTDDTALVGYSFVRPDEIEAAKSQRVSVSAEEMRTVTRASELSGVSVDRLLDGVKTIKAQFPQSKGWAPMVLKKFEMGEGSAGQRVARPVFQQVPWTFHVPNGATRMADAETQKRWSRTLSNRMYKEVMDVFARAASEPTSDEQARLAHNAQVILKNIGWYRGVTQRLNMSLGSMSQLFADMLGATSPQQNVDKNFEHALEIFQRFARGEFDALLDQYAAFLDAGNKPSAWKGRTINRPDGTQYGVNGHNALNALVASYREMKPGQRPKARNFAGNLGGTSHAATIDRWAARTLQRLAKRQRLAPMIAPGVPGMMGTKGNITGGFGFGQQVFAETAQRLNDANIGGLTWTPADLQALMWFVEKEHWMEHGWADKGGDGGSFEQILDERLRTDVIIGGISQATTEKPMGLPPAEQKKMSDRLMSAVSDDPSVLAYQATTTEGLFSEGDSVSSRETSFNMEVAVRDGFNMRGLLRRMAVEAKRAGQRAFMVSKPVDPTVSHPNLRPQLTMYFMKPLTRAQVGNVIAEYQKQHPYTGFTLLTDYRNRRRSGDMPATFIGLRSQYVPEFDPAGPELLAAGETAFADHMLSQFHAYHAMSVMITQGGMAQQQVANAQINGVDTAVYHEGDYDAIVAGTLGYTAPIKVGEGFTTASVFEQLARYHRTQPPAGKQRNGTDGDVASGDEALSRREDGAIEGSPAASGARWVGPRSGLNFADLYANANSVIGQRYVYNHLGVRTDDVVDPTRLKIYPLQQVFLPVRKNGESDADYNARAGEFAEQRVSRWLTSIGWNYKVFGPDANGNGWSPPNFKDFNYDNKTVWIYQPRDAHGSFHDYAYTLPWRVTHEVAHGLVNDRMSTAWGGVGRRQGAIGRVTTHPSGKGEVPPLSLADGMRAVDWEFETFRTQLLELEKIGVEITPLQYYQENIVNASDAVFRVLTGNFGDPVTAGIIPPELPAEYAAQLERYDGDKDMQFAVVVQAVHDFRARAFDVLRDAANYHGIPTYERLDAATGKVPSAEHLQVLDTTDAFWKFFKGSQVADDFGMPLVAFHGTNSTALAKFDPERSLKNNLYGPAAGYFTVSGEIGSEYSIYKLTRYLKSTSFGTEEQFTAFMNSDEGANSHILKVATNSYGNVNVEYIPAPVMAEAAANGYAPNVLPVYLSVKEPFDIDKAFSWADIEAMFDQKPVIDIMREYIRDTPTVSDVIEDMLVRADNAEPKTSNASSPDAWRPADRSGNRLVLGDWLYEALRRSLQRAGLDVEAASAVTNEMLAMAGFDGITHIGGRLLGGGAKEHKVWIAFEPTAVKSVFNGGTYDTAFDDIMMRRDEEQTTLDMSIDDAAHVDRSLRNSLGEIVRSSMVTASNFDTWFAGSKVVDSAGRPLVVYHGTPTGGFTRFDPRRKGITTVIGIPVETLRHGFFFTPDQQFAQSFADQERGKKAGTVIPVYLSIKNPLVLSETGVLERDIKKLVTAGVDEQWLRRHAGDPQRDWEQFDEGNGEFFTDALRTAGYDGVIMGETDPVTGKVHDVYVALDPTQIKSTDNAGSYSSATDDIMLRRATNQRATAARQNEGNVAERLSNWHARWNYYHTSTAARIRGITRTRTGYKIANMFDRDKFARISPTEKGYIPEDYHSSLSGALGRFMPQLTRILGSIAPGKERALAGILRGEYGRTADGKAIIPASSGVTVQQAREARAWLNDMYEYIAGAFAEAGEKPPAFLKNYFPQWYDVERGVTFDKTSRRPLQGVDKVTALHEFLVQAFLPQPEYDARGNHVRPANQTRLDGVRERVSVIIDKITNEGGIPMWGFDPMNELGKRTYNLTQQELQRMIHLDPGKMIPVKIGGRVIEMRLADFLHNDTITTLNKYAVSSARRAEFIRRFGSKGERLNEMLDQIDVERAEMGLPPLTPAERRTVITDAQANVGLLGRKIVLEHPRIYKSMEIVKTLGNLVMLNLSAISSLPEFISPLTRAGVGGLVASLQQNIRSVLFVPGAFNAAFRAARNAQPGDKFRQFKLAYNMTNSEMRQFAIDIGIIHEHMQYTLQGGIEDLEHTWIGRLNHVYFKYGNLLTPLTEMQQVGATAAAVRSIAAWGKATSPKTERFLREIGLTRAEAQAFNPRDINSASEKVKAAIRQMVGETIINPTSGKKPAWMSDPRWMLFAHIKSYITGFNNTILQRAIREATVGNPVPMIGVGMAAFLAAMLYELREWMRWGEEGNPYYNRLGLKKDDPLRFTLQMIDRGGLWGPAEPVASMIYGAKTGNPGSLAGALVPTLSMADRAVSGVSNLIVAAATGDEKYYRSGVDNLTRVVPVVNALGQYRVDLVTDITGVSPKN